MGGGRIAASAEGTMMLPENFEVLFFVSSLKS